MFRYSTAKQLLLVLILLPFLVSAQQKDPANKSSAIVMQPSPDQKRKKPDLTTVVPNLGQLPKSAGQAPRVISMPKLLGKRIKDAYGELQTLVRENGFERMSITPALSKQFDQKYGPNEVIRQEPEPGGRLSADSKVTLYYNPPINDPPTVMPYLKGRNLKEAEIMLDRLVRFPLNIREQTRSSSNAKEFEITYQFPEAGTLLKPNDVVVLYYNPNPPVTPTPVLITVPPLKEKTYRQATIILRNIGLNASSAPDSEAEYTVTGQTPSAGERLPTGGIVSLTLTAPAIPPQSPTPTPTPTPMPTLIPSPTPILVVVPDLSKKDLADAINLLQERQLAVGSITKAKSSGDENLVLTQRPKAGQRVPVGSQVDLEVSVLAVPPDQGGFNWTTGIIGIALAGFALLGLKKLKEKIWPSPPKLGFSTTPGESKQRIQFSSAPPLKYELQLLTTADAGQQHLTVKGNLIATESEEL